MEVKVSPARSLRGSVRLPGDKSISHRYAILGGLAEGTTRIQHYSSGADCHSTLGTLRALGIGVNASEGVVEIHGHGLDGLQKPSAVLDAGNSGSTMRILSGVLAAQPFTSRITGDESLSRRPMDRIMKPLGEMGAVIRARDGRFPPLEIEGRALRPIEYKSPIASAQVKTCVLLAGLFAEGTTTVVEPLRTRDHTEIALRQFGVDLESVGCTVSLRGRARLTAGDFSVPGDISSAAFFLVAASIVPDSRVVVERVGLNPTRAGLLDFLLSIGAKIRVLNIEEAHGEPVGDLVVESAQIRGGIIQGAMAAALIDEIPVLSVLGAMSEQGLEVRDARELRVKETDRIATVADNLRRAGVNVEEREDGFLVPGGQKFAAAAFDSLGDHRIAMAFTVAALAADGESVVANADAASVSYPEFFRTLDQLRHT